MVIAPPPRALRPTEKHVNCQLDMAAKKTTKKTTNAVAKLRARKAADERTSKVRTKPGPTKKATGKKVSTGSSPKKTAKRSVGNTAPTTNAGVVLLSGGNPQIPKGDGDAPVQAYLAAMPGWKQAVGVRLDELIVKAAPHVQKAVKWNSPFYGIEGKGWFLSFHCFTKYVKVAFLFGRALNPLPPGESKDKNARYLDVYEDTPLDEAQFVSWVRQAAGGEGWIP